MVARHYGKAVKDKLLSWVLFLLKHTKADFPVHIIIIIIISESFIPLIPQLSAA